VEAARAKRVYLVAPAVRALLLADRRGQLKVMSTGVKTFERQDSKVSIASLAMGSLPTFISLSEYVHRVVCEFVCFKDPSRVGQWCPTTCVSFWLALCSQVICGDRL
jgi:hypothetical protein